MRGFRGVQRQGVRGLESRKLVEAVTRAGIQRILDGFDLK